MAKITVNKQGKLVVIDDKKKQHSTNYKISSSSSKAEIKSAVSKAIGQHMGEPGVGKLFSKAGAIADTLYNKMQKTGKEKETPAKKGKAGKKKTEEKPSKKKGEKAPKEKKKKEKAEEVPVPKKKTVTVSISNTIIVNTLNLLKKKKDKKLQKELQKLAGSYTQFKEYLNENAAYVTAEIFNLLYKKEDFELYLNSATIENPEIGKLLEYMYENGKLAEDAESGVLELANDAIRSYLSSEIPAHAKLSEEVDAIGGVKAEGSMDAELFFTSVLYLRRLGKSTAPVLKLELVETVPEVKVEAPKEVPKVEEKDWTKQTKALAMNVEKGNVSEVKIPEGYPTTQLIEPLFIELSTDENYTKFIKSYKAGKKKIFAGLATPTVMLNTEKKQNLFIRSLQHYMIDMMEKDDKFKKDLEAAGLPTDIKKDGVVTPELIKSLSMLKWRERNPKANVWGAAVEKKPEKPKKKWKYNF